MSDEKIVYLSIKDAAKIVGAIQEEEDIERIDKRILTVYSRENKELCWFDFEEVMTEVEGIEKGEKKEAVHNYIMAHIPEWVLEL